MIGTRQDVEVVPGSIEQVIISADSLSSVN